jgi:hypothetical protein
MRFLYTLFSRSPLLLPALLALMFLLVGCGSAFSAPSASSMTSPAALSGVRSISTPTTKMYLGEVSGTRALLGIVLDGARVRAYVCDGTPSRLATLVDWFAGQVSGGRVQASSPDHARLTAQLTNQSASGILTLAGGRTYTFSVPQVSATTQIGVFEGTDLIGGQRYHAGWLLLPDGDQRGAASYYPTGPIRGGIVIALVREFPTGPV